MDSMLSRRFVLQGMALFALLPTRADAAGALITVHKNPSCDCCEGWVEHLRLNGFTATVVETTELNRVKTRLGVPSELASCHTAEVGPYVLEGHVPAAAVKRLLVERPAGKGLAVPGMPSGSPGMTGEPEDYEVILFGGQQTRVYGRFKADKQL